MNTPPSIAAKAARCPDQAVVNAWAKKHGIMFVNRSHGEQTAATISMAALVDLAGHWSESEAVAIVPVGVMEKVRNSLLWFQGRALRSGDDSYGEMVATQALDALSAKADAGVQ